MASGSAQSATRSSFYTSRASLLLRLAAREPGRSMDGARFGAHRLKKTFRDLSGPLSHSNARPMQSLTVVHRLTVPRFTLRRGAPRSERFHTRRRLVKSAGIDLEEFL